MENIFEIESGLIRVSDPCYDKSGWGTLLFSNCKIGKWIGQVVEIGDRIGSLCAMHKDIDKLNTSKWLKEKIDIGVDSGQVGIYDDRYYRDNKIIPKSFDFKYNDHTGKDNIWNEKDWYGMNACITLKKESWGIIPFGCVSSSGYGDGCYPVYYLKEKGSNEIVGLEIRYIKL